MASLHKHKMAAHDSMMGSNVSTSLNGFCGDKSPFCAATGTLCFRLQLTLPMGFKARVDPSLSALCSCLNIMILRVNSEFPGLGLVPILHLGMVRLPLQ